MGWGIIRYWGVMGPVVTQRAHVLPKRVANSDFSSVVGKKEKSTPWLLGASLHSPSGSLGNARSRPGTIS